MPPVKLTPEKIQNQIADPDGGWKPISNPKAMNELQGLFQITTKTDMYVKEVETDQGKVRFLADRNGFYLTSEFQVSGLWGSGVEAGKPTRVKVYDYGDKGDLSDQDHVQIRATSYRTEVDESGIEVSVPGSEQTAWHDFKLENDVLVASGFCYTDSRKEVKLHPSHPDVGPGDPTSVEDLVRDSNAMELIRPGYQKALEMLFPEPEKERPPAKVAGPSE